FSKATRKQDKVMVSFSGIDQGLTTKDGNAPTCFELSADGKEFVTATATVQGKQVSVHSDKTPAPKFVRMGWFDTATPTLRDKNGWPVLAFPAQEVKEISKHKIMKTSSLLISLATMALATASALSSDALYPPKENRKPSPGNTSYFIDPAKGDDKQSGLKRNLAWRSFSRINQLVLAPGDKVKITAPGSFDQTLMIIGSGTAGSPVEVSFAPGRYDFHTKNQCRRKFNISNTNGSPEADKLIAIFLKDSKHINVAGPGAEIICRGKMMEVCIDHGENVMVSGLTFDYKHPTVTEYKVVAVGDGYVDLQVHKDSRYSIDGGKLTWKGEGWSFVGGLGQ
ncbi:MAG: hypothetical protein N2F24_05695, partial [Deltaproteobacteria bacterium]